MMPDTPLTEVASHLPTEAANHLLQFHETVQEAVLKQVRMCMLAWEAGGYTFDPIQYDGVLNVLVKSLAGPYGQIRELVDASDQLLEVHQALILVNNGLRAELRNLLGRR